jgi:hypothetical protein
MALFTYDDSSRRESLLSVLRDVSVAADNYLVTNLGKSTATNTLHEWVVDNVSRPTSVTFATEGSDFSNPQHTSPARSTNITAIIRREVQVSETEKAIKAALPGDPMDYQKKKTLTAFKADMEFALLNGTRASGASGTARGMTGINGVISTNLTARASGTSMSVTELEDILQNSWEQADPANTADIVLCPMGIKRKIATFTTRVTHNVDSTNKLYNDISFFEGSSGTVKIIPHRDVINGTGTTHVYALREDAYKMAFLQGREPAWKDVPSVGDYDRGVYLTEMTLESRAERASVKRYGYNLNG